MSTLESIFKGIDFWAALMISVASMILLPSQVDNNAAGEIYSVGINVLSIVFAVYFTAFAIIIAAGDDGFVNYLQQMKFYGILMQVFRFTLWLLFVSLVLSVGLFVLTIHAKAAKEATQTKWFLVSFAFLSSYALFATMFSTHHAFNYARYRVRFLAMEEGDDGAVDQSSLE